MEKKLYFTCKPTTVKKFGSPLLLLLITFSWMASCSKGDNSGAPSKTKSELLVQSSWKFDHATATGYGDVSSAIDACLKDNIATFASNGNLTVTEGANVCSTSYAGTYTWTLQSGETVLHLSAPIFPGGSNDFTLVSVTETTLVLSQTMTVSPYPATTIEVTFIH